MQKLIDAQKLIDWLNTKIATDDSCVNSMPKECAGAVIVFCHKTTCESFLDFIERNLCES